METKKQKSIFGIKMHAQLQTFNGRDFEFQPEHLFCDRCWEEVDEAFSTASYYGSCRAMRGDANGISHDHSITVTKLNK